MVLTHSSILPKHLKMGPVHILLSAQASQTASVWGNKLGTEVASLLEMALRRRGGGGSGQG